MLPVSSGVSGSVVTLTNRNGGTGADVDVRHSYQPDESLPPGVALTIAVGTAGAGDPDITDATDAVDAEKFNIIGHPYQAAASMTALEGVLTTRWNAVNQLDGLAFTGFRGTAAAATTYGNARNSQFSSVMAISDIAFEPIPEWAGAIAGAVSLAGSADPARPFQGIPLAGVLPAFAGQQVQPRGAQHHPVRWHGHAQGQRRAGGAGARHHHVPARLPVACRMRPTWT